MREREIVNILIQHLLDFLVIPFFLAADGMQAWAPTSIIKNLGRQPSVDSSARSPTGDVVFGVILYSLYTGH